MNYVEIAAPFFIASMGVEYLYGVVVGKQTYRFSDTVNSLSLGVISRLVELLKLSFSAVVFSSLAGLAGVEQWSMNAWWLWAIAFVAYDFCYYWKHRFGHESKLFWASHVAHHQSEEFNLSTALRQTGTDYIGFVFYIPLYLIGVPAEAVITVGSLNLIYQFWVHTEHIRRLGPLEWLFITPSNHRVHHARNPDYLDKNYGGVFIVWDRLFGTFQAERSDEPCVYGITTGLRSWNPIWANCHFWWQTAKVSYCTHHWRDKILVWFKGPGWWPDDAKPPKMADWRYPKFDVPLRSLTKWYVFIQFWLLTAGTLWVLPQQNDLSRILAVLLFLWFAFSLYVCGQFLEGRIAAVRLEWTRLFMGVALAAGLLMFWPGQLSTAPYVLTSYSLVSALFMIAMNKFATGLRLASTEAE